MLILEDGTGKPDAETYASVEEANAYHLARGNDVWATISQERKEQLLRTSADYITYIFGPSFIGIRAVPGQALAWPRTTLYDLGYLFSLAVPVQIKEAQIEFALINHTTPLMPNSSGGFPKQKVVVGPIEVEYYIGGGSGSSGSSTSGARFPAAAARLGMFLDPATTGMMARVVRT